MNLAMTWVYIIASVLGVSLISFIGIVTFQREEDKMKPFLLVLVSFAAGALLGDVFIHLLPEAVEEKGLNISMSLWILGGILIFFILEKFIQWHHCHLPEEHAHRPKPLAIMNLVGDGLHNFIDGLIIAGSYFVSVPIGLATTIAVALHEIPQEIGDFGVLIHSGLNRSRVLILNFMSALMAVLGALVVIFFTTAATVSLHEFLIPFTVGGFIYIASADLIPELHKELNPLNSLVQLLSLIAGIAIMLALLLLE